MKITLLGAGKLGKQLYRAFVETPEISLVQWYDRSALSKLSPEGIPIITSLSEIQEANLYLLSISDDALEEVSSKLPLTSFVVHTAGSVPMDAIPQKRRGVFYPLQSFSDNQAVDFSMIPFGIETTVEKDAAMLMQLAHLIGGSPKNLSSNQREVLHLSAVLVNNFTNHLLTHAAKLCASQNLSFELLRPLLMETVRKTEQLKPHEAQTGPALRNDQKTIHRHLERIEDQILKKIYKKHITSIQTYYENEKL